MVLSAIPYIILGALLRCADLLSCSDQARLLFLKVQTFTTNFVKVPGVVLQFDAEAYATWGFFLFPQAKRVGLARSNTATKHGVAA